MRVNRANQSELENKAELQLLDHRHNASKGTCHPIQMGKDTLAVSSVPPRENRKGYMLGNTSSLNFMDHDITDAQKVLELAREKYWCAKCIPGTRAHIIFIVTFHVDSNEGGIRFEGYECSISVNKKEYNQVLDY
jgi:hypothetical protein